MDWYKLTVDETVEKLNTNPQAGLSAAEVQQRQQKYGPNRIEEQDVKSPWVIFLSQFKEIMVIILIIAAIISALLGEYIDATVILAILVLNAILGFTQEYRAEKSMAALKELAVPVVRTRRDGHIQEILSTELVPGDIVLLKAGNLVPADGRLLEKGQLDNHKNLCYIFT